MSGEHPFAASAASAAQHMADTTPESNGATAATMDDASISNAPRVKGAAKLQGIPGLGRALARNPIVGPTPQLTGLAQMVGFALGSPEFQRR
jgi:hypothetical protein